MLKKFVALWASIAVLALFFIGHYVFGRDDAKIVVDSLVIGAAVTIVLTWGRAAIVALRSGVQDGASNILVSIWLIWLCLLGLFVWIVAFQASGRPDWLRQTPIGGTISALIFLSGAYAIMVPVRDVVQLPIPTLWRWMVGVGAGMFVAGSLMTLAFLRIVDFS